VVRIGLIGAGWRSEYYLRIAAELPWLFDIATVLTASQQSADRLSADWAIPTTTDLSEFRAQGPYDYVVVSVPRAVAPELIHTLSAADIPVLTETPPARDRESLRALWSAIGGAPVQVAEQYRFQPQHSARLAVAASGALGIVHAAEVSVAHEYHGVSLIRAALGIGFEPVEVTARLIPDRVVAARGRDGWFDRPDLIDAPRTWALLRFDAGIGIYDFADEQYVSPIRSRHITIRGTEGELRDDTVHHLAEAGRSVTLSLARESTGIDGDLEGSFLRRIALGAEVVYENQFIGARLNDDELAVAEVMVKMAHFARTGEPFYSLADGCHDHYLGLLMAESAQSGRAVSSSPQPWSDSVSVLSRTAG
jgi:predicted dehydrogenase